MAITLTTADANIRPWQGRWRVYHPYNDTILADCDTEQEARDVREILNDLPRQLRLCMRHIVR